MGKPNPLYEPLALFGFSWAGEIPKAVMRVLFTVRVVAVILLCGGLLGSLLIYLVGKLTGMWFIRPWMTFIWGALTYAWIFILPQVVVRRYARTLRDSDFRVCADCGHALTGLPSEHRCPECGKQFEAEKLREYWMSWLNSAGISTSSEPARPET